MCRVHLDGHGDDQHHQRHQSTSINGVVFILGSASSEIAVVVRKVNRHVGMVQGGGRWLGQESDACNARALAGIDQPGHGGIVGAGVGTDVNLGLRALAGNALQPLAQGGRIGKAHIKPITGATGVHGQDDGVGCAWRTWLLAWDLTATAAWTTGMVIRR